MVREERVVGCGDVGVVVGGVIVIAECVCIEGGRGRGGEGMLLLCFDLIRFCLFYFSFVCVCDLRIQKACAGVY